MKLYPLFHGEQLSPGTNIDDFIKVLDVYKELYLWVSTWTLGDWVLKDEDGKGLIRIERKNKRFKHTH